MKKMSVDEIIQAPGEEYTLLKESILQELNCAKPGIVRSYNPVDQTVTVELAIQSLMEGRAIKPPILTDVPVFFPGNRTSGLTFPIDNGDECLVVFADHCIDAWFQNGGSSVPISVRRHDLSDGFAFVGFRSRKNALKGLDSGSAYGRSMMLEAVYPIGAVYWSTSPTDPSELFGGEWEEVPEMTIYCWTRVG